MKISNVEPQQTGAFQHWLKPGPWNAQSGAVTWRTGHHSRFAGADLICLSHIAPAATCDVTILDPRLVVARRISSIDENICPPPGSIWEERWTAFSDFERVCWRAAVTSDSLLALVDDRTDQCSLEILQSTPMHSRLFEAFSRSQVVKTDDDGWPTDWTEDERARFDAICHESMVRLRLFQPTAKRYCPSNYGDFWRTYEGGIDWYTWMYQSRKIAHENCLSTIHALEREVGRKIRVMDIGCGMGVGYSEALQDQVYIGVDLSPKCIDWCKQNRRNPNHTYLCRNVLIDADLTELKSFEPDFVFSQGTIDNSFDMAAYLGAIRAITSRWLYVTAYRGWFPELATHRYMWEPSTTVYYNDTSPRMLRQQFSDLGFSQLAISPLPTGYPPPQPPNETRIIAELLRDEPKAPALAAHQTGGSAYAPYRVEISPIGMPEVEAWCQSVRSGMAALDLLNSFGLYEAFFDGVEATGRFDLAPLCEFRQPSPSGRPRLFLRHDCDADIGVALKMAAHLKSRGIVGSFYLLHTSHYYGDFEGMMFRRHAAMDEIVTRLLATGQEIGLHHDPLHVYLNVGVDGVDAMRAEIAYLRLMGADIRGVVAHNSAFAYGADNVEIFHGLTDPNRTSVEWNGASAPLQAVSLADLGLDYEGNHVAEPRVIMSGERESFLGFRAKDPIRNPEWQKRYFLHNPFLKTSADASVWIVGRDHWLIADHRGAGILHSPNTHDEVQDWLRQTDCGKIVVNFHPDYFGGA